MRTIPSLLIAVILSLPLTQCAWFSKEAPEDGVLQTKVVRISEEFANINTDLTGAVLAQHGIVVGTTFQFRYKDQTFGVLLGENYGDVDKGEWVGLIEEDGHLQLAVSYGNAATDIGCVVGDMLYVELAD